MQFFSALSTRQDSEAAVHDVIEQLRAHVDTFDLLSVFFTHHHSGDADSIAQTLQDAFAEPTLIGCSSEGVIAAGREIEDVPGLAVLGARLPGVRINPFHISRAQWPAAMKDQDSFTDHLSIHSDTRAVIALGDPWTTPIGSVLQEFADFTPNLPLVGGMASSGQRAGENVLLFNDARFDEGLTGVSLSGPIVVETVVSQGCRPVGERFVVTRGEGNTIQQLSGRPALTVLEHMVHSLPEPEKQLLSRGLLIGQAMTEYKDTFARGDFAVRSIVDVDAKNKTLGVGDYIRVGQTVQFHVRDEITADEDLNLLLAARKTATPAGALLFSCNGRGSRLFSQRNHDAQAAARLMPNVPLVGFFAAGELGPVGGRNFIHGHTASFALFSSP